MLPNKVNFSIIKKGSYYLIYFKGLDHEQNMKKMRLLSFMQIAESNPEISFDVIEKELQIKSGEVENFIIEGMVFFKPLKWQIGENKWIALTLCEAFYDVNNSAHFHVTPDIFASIR